VTLKSIGNSINKTQSKEIMIFYRQINWANEFVGRKELHPILFEKEADGKFRFLSLRSLFVWHPDY